MRILSIMTKEFKENFANKQVMLLMILFPIVIIAILGFAFSNNFNTNFKFQDIKVVYTDKSGNEGISLGFKKFIKAGKKIGIEFKEVEKIDEGINNIKNGKYSAYILLNNEGIILYKNERNDLEANIIENMVSVFVDRYKTIDAIAKVNPLGLKNITNIERDFTKIVSLDRKKALTSFDYYSVTMLTLIILYGSIGGVFAIDDERTRKTGMRILASPTKKYEILTGKLLGTAFSVFIQSVIIFAFSKYIYGAYWGHDIITVFLLITSEILFSVSIGIGLGFIIKNGRAAQGLVNAIIPFIAFLGGSYFPISSMNSKLLIKLSNASPITWINTAIFNVILNNDYKYILTAVLVNLIPALFFIVLSAYLFKKEAF
ncbi:ABC transporter permease [Thermovorax subterraneus]|nr:ABC transporter permease [Thermovorax subterraneus]